MFVKITWEEKDIKGGLMLESPDGTKYMIGRDMSNIYHLVCLTTGFIGQSRGAASMAEDLNYHQMKPVDFPKFVEEKIMNDGLLYSGS